MTIRFWSSIVFSVAVVAGFSMAPTPAVAQGAAKGGAKGAARAVPADPRQSLAVPRLANGKPDFSGVWDHSRVPDMAKSSPDGVCVAGSYGCKSISSGPLPYTPAGLKANDQSLKFDYTAVCLPWGYTRSWNGLYPNQIIQSPDFLGMMFEQNNNFKIIYTDGRPMPKDPEPTWMGTSVGHWEGDTLVVESAGFHDQLWLDTGVDNDDPRAAPHITTDAMRITEHISRPDFTHLNYEVKIEDPNLYTGPITNTRVFVLMKPGQDVMEFSCEENNKEVTEGHLRDIGTKKK